MKTGDEGDKQANHKCETATRKGHKQTHSEEHRRQVGIVWDGAALYLWDLARQSHPLHDPWIEKCIEKGMEGKSRREPPRRQGETTQIELVCLVKFSFLVSLLLCATTIQRQKGSPPEMSIGHRECHSDATHMKKARKSKAAMSCRCRPPPCRGYQQDSPEGRHIMTGLSFLLKRISSRDIGCGDGSSGALSDWFYYPLQPRPTSSNIVIITSLNPPSFSINNPSK